MTFWDTSAITPLLVKEDASRRRRADLGEFGQMVVWHATPAEIESAISRRVREMHLDPRGAEDARRRLALLSESWIEVEPTGKVRARAIRLLRTHALRAGDAFKLAAALAATEEQPDGALFFTGDARLGAAAKSEGFAVR
jgi:predicted nucleic acid-binding protein